MKVVFQLIDVDYFLNANKPVIRMFGRTADGGSVCVCLDDFSPYFYVDGEEKTLKESLQEIQEVVNIEDVEKFPAVGYLDKPVKMFKISVMNPQNVPEYREKLMDQSFVKTVYEADILFKYRFMVDLGIKGMDWIEIDGEKMVTKTTSVPTFHTSKHKIKVLDKVDMSELRYFSFDLEVVPSDITKPIESVRDPIIMISVSFFPEFRGMKDLVMVAKKINGKGIMGFTGEKEMLQEFLNIIKQYDPDVLTGYNCQNFDLPYIIDRLKANRLPQNFGRVLDKNVFCRKFGISTDCQVSGRVVVDPYVILKSDPYVRFQRYTLDNVCKEMLGEGKEDVKYGDMPRMWNGSRADLNKLISYARKDAVLNLRLILEKGLLDKFFALCGVAGILLQDSLGGQAVRVETMILHDFKKTGFVMSPRPSSGELRRRTEERETKQLKGAVVLEPIKGLHADGCTLVLDFLSLYPSLMRTYNISPDTLILNDKLCKKIKKKHKSPIGDYFVDEKLRKGFMPRLLEEIMNARDDAKKMMRAAKNDEEERVYNARQIALKVMANSFYGYNGYLRARLYTMPVAGGITGYGRVNLEKVGKIIEDEYKLKLIYGDTDSVFIGTDLTDLEKARKLGEKIGKEISDNLPGVLDLEFEKIYRTFLILTKKRYAGWKFEPKGDGWKEGLETKGIETVRRDWCSLVTDTMKEILNIILKDGDLKKAVKVVQEVLNDLKNSKIPLDKLTIVKGITKSMDKYTGTLPHIELARKLNRRNPAEPVQIGTRLGYVIIKGNQMLSKRAEDPEYVKEHGLHIDSEYYIHKQVLPPILRVMNAVGVSDTEIFGSGRQVNLSDMMNGTKRKMKHDINIEGYNPNKSVKKSELPVAEPEYVEKDIVLEDWEEFICQTCKKSLRRMPLSGCCDCGGKMLFGYHGNMSDKFTNGN